MSKKRAPKKPTAVAKLQENNIEDTTPVDPTLRSQHSIIEETHPDVLNPNKRVYRSRNVADLLLSTSDISEEAYSAACRYRDSYELGLFGVSNPERSSSGGGSMDFCDFKLAAVTSLRDADACLGYDGRLLMRLFMIEGKTLDAVKEIVGVSYRRLRAIIISVFERLASHYSGDLYRPVNAKRSVIDDNVEETVIPESLDALRDKVEDAIKRLVAEGWSMQYIRKHLVVRFGSRVYSVLSP